MIKNLGLVHGNSIRAMTSGIRIKTDSGFCWPVFVPAMCSVVVAQSGKVALADAGTTCMKSLLLLMFVVMLAAGAIAVAATSFGHNLSGHLDPPEIENVEN